jgi:hypothetical protein
MPIHSMPPMGKSPSLNAYETLLPHKGFLTSIVKGDKSMVSISPINEKSLYATIFDTNTLHHVEYAVGANGEIVMKKRHSDIEEPAAKTLFMSVLDKIQKGLFTPTGVPAQK